jgi:hypothetical protein
MDRLGTGASDAPRFGIGRRRTGKNRPHLFRYAMESIFTIHFFRGSTVIRLSHETDHEGVAPTRYLPITDPESLQDFDLPTQAQGAGNSSMRSAGESS